jgi:hypothetical protein
MRGRYASFLPPDLIARLFGTVNPLPNLQPTWNLAPTNDAPVIRRDRETGERHLDVLKWGLVPYFTKGPKPGRKPINARSEIILWPVGNRREYTGLGHVCGGDRSGTVVCGWTNTDRSPVAGILRFEK